MQLNRNNFLSFLIQSEPGKSAITNGLRAALSLGILMLISQLINIRESGLFIGLIAYFVNFVNVAGSYQIKARAMAIASLGIAISVFVGTLVASIPILAVMTLLVYIGRFTNATTVLAVHLKYFRLTVPLPELATFAHQISLVLEQLADAVEQDIMPPPLPDLDAMLQRIQPHLQALRTARVSELEIDRLSVNAENRGDTPMRQAVIDYSILDLEIDQIVRRLTAMYLAIVRLTSAASG
jgi:hypothetical protein